MRRYQFQFSSHSHRSFEVLPKDFQKRILEKLSYFQSTHNPLRFAKKLQGLDHRFRFRIGDYRVIVARREYDVLIILVILKIGHRRDVYES